MSSWFKWISSEDICLKSVYKLKNVQNEHVSIMVNEVIQKLVYDHDSKMFFVGRIDWSTTRDLDFYTTVVRQRLTHFNSALNLKNASIFGVSIFGEPPYVSLLLSIITPTVAIEIPTATNIAIVIALPIIKFKN